MLFRLLIAENLLVELVGLEFNYDLGHSSLHVQSRIQSLVLGTGELLFAQLDHGDRSNFASDVAFFEHDVTVEELEVHFVEHFN